MSLHEDMAADHRRDYEAQNRMRELRLEIDAFLAAPPSRCHEVTREALRVAVDRLVKDCDHITAVWD